MVCKWARLFQDWGVGFLTGERSFAMQTLQFEQRCLAWLVVVGNNNVARVIKLKRTREEDNRLQVLLEEIIFQDLLMDCPLC